MDATLTLLSKYQHGAPDPASPTPLYHQLYAMLRDCIHSGILEHGARMPSEKELSTTFNVSRITARRALDDLAAESLVARQRGRGTFVNYHYRPELLNAPLTGALESLEHMGRETKIKVLSLRFIQPPAPIADEFGITQQQTLCQMVRIRSNRGLPFAYYESWTAGFDESISKAALEKRPRLELLREQGIRFARAEQTLSAEAAMPAAAEALDITHGKPLLKLIRRSFTEDGKQTDYLNALYNSDRFQYRMALTMK
ncbi:MAG: GntR family transcriptional regulator [Gammaproteobacteria bacterium]|nr:GntR family transcriptional regulator [Gammaproteobacteria bacterium]MCY4210920.1 GntR family transcriptional regulator [Gammaproteobacteria bacterium]MCY4282273.1 GntR family transcriptional regulator [Gammaproteobacteria bacterium]MCY4338240.1 GntR family transcriptional regulator [Gammaproteobacteria bacterium]